MRLLGGGKTREEGVESAGALVLLALAGLSTPSVRPQFAAGVYFSEEAREPWSEIGFLGPIFPASQTDYFLALHLIV